MPLHLYNTITHRVEEFAPADPSRVTFYTCGPTVYDYAHIGNFRSFLAADLLRRWLESPLCELVNDGKPPRSGGPPRTVLHVMNITDVGHMTDDDSVDGTGEDRMAVAGKRLAEAKKAGKLPPGVSQTIDPNDPYAIAKFYADAFVEDARRLGLKVAVEAQSDASLMPRASANVAGMIKVIGRLIERGYAYAVGEPGSRVVYFRVKKFEPYGRLSGNTLEKLREGEGGRISAANQVQKEHPADFMLWKEDPSHIMKWESPWGAGYPGWHIECTVMSAGRLAGGTEQLLAHPTADGTIIDLHSGGEDNIFPHHECEIAQSCCAFGVDPAAGRFARHWFHARFLLVEGSKMSKSKGNFYTIRDLLEKGHEHAAIRLELIKTHYRSNANFTEQGLKDSARMVERWRRFAAGDSVRGEDTGTKRARGTAGTNNEARERARGEFADSLHDDLNIAGAIGAVNTLVSAVAQPGVEDVALMREFDSVLGVLELDRAAETVSDIGVFTGVEPSAEVNAKLEERRAARAAKDFKRSDAIRDELQKMGYAIKDVAGGKVEVRRA